MVRATSSIRTRPEMNMADNRLRDAALFCAGGNVGIAIGYMMHRDGRHWGWVAFAVAAAIFWLLTRSLGGARRG